MKAIASLNSGPHFGRRCQADKPGVALNAVKGAAEDDFRDRAPDIGERRSKLVVAKRRI